MSDRDELILFFERHAIASDFDGERYIEDAGYLADLMISAGWRKAVQSAIIPEEAKV